MKKTLLLTLLLATASANATVTIQGFYGTLFNSSNVAVPNGTVFALVVDSNSSNSFAGGFGLNSSIDSQANANAAFTAGQTLTLGGTLGGDTIFALGTVDSSVSGAAGTAGPVLTLTLGQNGLAANLNYAIYWFPGANLNGNIATIGTQAGGIHSTGSPALDVLGMTVPAEGATVSQGFVTSDQGGNVAAANVHAWNLVPEPSAALLGLLGAVGLIRRKR